MTYKQMPESWKEAYEVASDLAPAVIEHVTSIGELHGGRAYAGMHRLLVPWVQSCLLLGADAGLRVTPSVRLIAEDEHNWARAVLVIWEMQRVREVITHVVLGPQPDVESHRTEIFIRTEAHDHLKPEIHELDRGLAGVAQAVEWLNRAGSKRSPFPFSEHGGFKTSAPSQGGDAL